MSIRSLIGIGALMVCGVGAVASGQQRETSARAAQVAVRNVIPQVDVVIELQGGDEQVVVPYCGETEYGTPILCGVRVRLEVHSREGWRPAKLRTTFAVLGGAPVRRMAEKRIEPRGKAVLVFTFSRRFYDVEIGQRLRVVVTAWPDETSLKTGGRQIELASSSFKCPESGTGR